MTEDFHPEFNFKMVESLPLKYVRPLSQGGTMKDLNLTKEMQTTLDPAHFAFLQSVAQNVRVLIDGFQQMGDMTKRLFRDDLKYNLKHRPTFAQMWRDIVVRSTGEDRHREPGH